MGCCASTNHKNSAAAAAFASDIHPRSAAAGLNRTPPPSHPVLEEEFVKEVLSETPTVPKTYIAAMPNNKFQRGIMKTSEPKIRGGGDFNLDNNVVYNNPRMVTSEQLVSSDICSSTATDSVATTVTAEKREDDGDGEVYQKLVNRSPAKITDRSLSGDYKREKVVGRSPARMSDPSPGRSRSVPRQETRGGSVVAEGQRGKDSGGRSGRRSRSPATRTNNGGMKMGCSGGGGGLGKSQSTRVSGKSPGRIRSDFQEKNRKGEESEREYCKCPPPTNSESFENPLVSLECFIFL